MSDNVLRKEEEIDSLSKSGFGIYIILLVVLIPLIYTILTNFKKPAPPIEIKPIAAVAPVQKVNPATVIENALKATVENPGFQTFLNLGLEYYNAARYPESIEAWTNALEYNPKSDLAYNNIAAAYGAMNKWDEEIEACKKALAINPGLDLAKRNLAWAQEMKNKK